MNVVDSSAWLEYFADGPNASWFASAVETTDELIVPSLTILEVFKKLATDRGDNEALQAVGAMQQGHVVDLDPALANGAARIGIKHQLPLADSIIFATARAFDATLWTQDSDFQSLPGVKFKPVAR